jgi:hypothetical protein
MDIVELRAILLNAERAARHGVAETDDEQGAAGGSVPRALTFLRPHRPGAPLREGGLFYIHERPRSPNCNAPARTCR